MRPQELDLRGTGATPLSRDELQITGGIIWTAVLIAVGVYIIDNWADIKQGAYDGWNS